MTCYQRLLQFEYIGINKVPTGISKIVKIFAFHEFFSSRIRNFPYRLVFVYLVFRQSQLFFVRVLFFCKPCNNNNTMRYPSSLSECIKRLLDMYWNPLQTLNVRKQLFLISVVLSIADILKLENVVSNCQISIVNFHSVIKVSQFINHMLFLL